MSGIDLERGAPVSNLGGFDLERGSQTGDPLPLDQQHTTTPAPERVPLPLDQQHATAPAAALHPFDQQHTTEPAAGLLPFDQQYTTAQPPLVLPFDQQHTTAQPPDKIPLDQQHATEPAAGLLPLDQQHTTATAAGLLPLDQQHATAAAADRLPLDQQHTTSPPAPPVAPLPFDQQHTTAVYAPVVVPIEDIQSWGVRVMLDGVDVSDGGLGGDCVVSTTNIEAEEGAARVAEVQLYTPGPYTPSDFVNKPIEIYVQRKDSGGVVAQEILRFRGVVNEPIVDVRQGIVTMRCTDKLQNDIEAMTRDQIAALLPGSTWSPLVGRDDADSWEYMQERVGTLPGSVQKTIAGDIVYTPWASSPTPHVTYTDDDYLDGTLQIESMQARNLHNQVKLAVSGRYLRAWQREWSSGWTTPRTFNFYLERPTTLPNKAMFRTAAEGTGWNVASYAFTELPETGSYVVGSGPGNTTFIKTTSEIVTSATITLVRRWLQTINEIQDITVNVPASQARHGVLPKEQSLSGDLTVESDFESNFTLSAREDVPTTKNNVPDVPNSITLTEGYLYTDLLVRKDMDELVEIGLRKAHRGLVESSRETTCVLELPLQPQLDLLHTAELATSKVASRGKARRVVDQINHETGRAVTRIEIAIHRGGGGAGGDTLSAPIPPTGPTIDTPDDPENNITQFGGLLPDPIIDPTLSGYIGTYSPEDAGSIVPEVQLAFEAPAIPDRQRTTDELSGNGIFNIVVDDDPLVVTL